ncbi:MAG: dihydropteroate synthase [Bacteroidota bacterium]
MLHPNRTLNCKGQLLFLDTPIVMGILNVTPDSFFDGGKYNSGDRALFQAEKMLEEGATIIDIGGMSSRPGAETITVAEELKRVLTVIERLHQKLPTAILSIDTVHSEVARKAVEAGASIINDISAGSIDQAMYETVAQLNVPYILMHMQGNPKTMQLKPEYKDVKTEVLDFMIQEVGKLKDFGVKDIVIDPGFGFGKRLEDNYDLLKNMHIFQILGVPVLAGISRKSMIYKYLEIGAINALNGTTALHMIALQQGANILRVHDVKEAVEVLKLWELLEKIEDQ